MKLELRLPYGTLTWNRQTHSYTAVLSPLHYTRTEYTQFSRHPYINRKCIEQDRRKNNDIYSLNDRYSKAINGQYSRIYKDGQDMLIEFDYNEAENIATTLFNMNYVYKLNTDGIINNTNYRLWLSTSIESEIRERFRVKTVDMPHLWDIMYGMFPRYYVRVSKKTDLIKLKLMMG